jgi:outer membrane immunogenic protein
LPRWRPQHPINTELRENIFRVGLNYRIGGRAYAPVVAANWAGFYLGGNFGSGTGRDRSTLNLPAVGIFQTFNLAPDGINGGVQAGYNWQAANWVFGLEADIQGSTQKDNKTCVLACVPGGVTAAYDATLPWFGTVRGRLGYSVGSTLFYATGGLAYGKRQDQDRHQLLRRSGDAIVSRTPMPAGPRAQASKRRLRCWDCWARTGPPRPSISTSISARRRTASYIGAVPATTTRSVTEHVFRTGLNYHFNSPVVAKY